MLSVDSPGLSVGTPMKCPTSVAMAPMSALSTQPMEKVVRSMSRTPDPKQKTRRAPGAATWMAVATPRNSASPCTTVPARVTGDVAPAIVME